jgi:hypothetical protein
VPSKSRRSKWIKRGIHSLRKANMSWNTPMNSLADHLNEKPNFRRWGHEMCLQKKTMHK